MLLNYLRVAIRLLVRQRLYTALNVAGLALGVATAAMMGLFVWHETHFDGFFRNADRIYRVLEVDHPPGRAPNRLSVLAKPLGPVLVQDIPEVAAMAWWMTCSSTAPVRGWSPPSIWPCVMSCRSCWCAWRLTFG